ncbi:MAG: DUF5916 domain-containing protein [Vicinamibacteria bacterium]
MRPGFTFALALILASHAPARADELDTLPPAPTPPAVVARDSEGRRVTVRATRIAEPVFIDGLLNETTYGAVEAIQGFVQQEPHEGAEATEPTDVWLFFDDDNVYVSARCWDSHPERMVGNEMRRDHQSLSRNENFGVAFDTFHDRRNSFMFHVNLLGGLTDALAVDERNVNKDWNTIWNARTARFEKGWTVEIAIPFKSLRFRSREEQVWGVNFRRIVQWKNEISYLSPVPASYDLRGIVKASSAATLVGLEVAPARNLEIKPYAISTLRTDRNADPVVRNDFGADAGLDVKYGITSSLVADVTVNTDFAQVEDDELQVNLTRFDVFYPEKREFFLEGRGIFSFGNAGFGGDGGGGDPGRGPDNAPILFFSRRIGLSERGVVPIRAGARMTGKVGAYTLGVLNIHTASFQSAGLEPTGFSVVRVKRDIFRKSQVGAIVTHRSQSIETKGTNQVFGIDGSFGLSDSLVVGGYYAGTRTSGLSGEDASYRGVFDYNSDLYGARLTHTLVGDNFNPEIGFLRRENLRESVAKLRLSRRPQSVAAVRKISLEPGLEYVTDTDGRLETRQAQMTFRMELQSGDEWNVDYEQNYEFLPEPFEVYPGFIVPVGGYDFDNMRISYQLGPQRKISGRVTYQFGGFLDGTRNELSYRGRIETSPRLSIEPNLSVNQVELPEGEFTATLLGARVTLNLSPRMSWSALVQHSSAESELLTNLRFRWEYQPGSDLFVVYNDGRSTGFDGRPLWLESRSFAVKITRLVRF